MTIPSFTPPPAYLEQSYLPQCDFPYGWIIFGLNKSLDSHQSAIVTITTFVHDTVGAFAQTAQFLVPFHFATLHMRPANDNKSK